MALTLFRETTTRLILPISDFVTLEQSGIPGASLAMRPLNDRHIEDLVNSDISTWPLVRVTHTDQGYILYDGYHRKKAAEIKGASTLEALCQSFDTENDVIDAAFRANVTHGLKASSETRSDYAFWLHITYPTMKQEEIGARTHMTQSTVSEAIAKREKMLRDAELGKLGYKEEYNAEQACKKFSRRAVKFMAEIETMQDEEIVQFIQRAIKPGDKEKLARMGRVLLGAYGGA
jgi:hypothetical protein